MKRKSALFASLVILVFVSIVVNVVSLSAGWLGFSLFFMFFLALIGFGWISLERAES